MTFLIFLAGICAGVALNLALLSKQKKIGPRKLETIIHMRGHRPAWYAKSSCENRSCSVWHGNGWGAAKACYLDQDGRYWCEHHLPADTKVAERAALDETEDGRCVRHDWKCPKPWEPY